jgi:hypothetical protein
MRKISFSKDIGANDLFELITSHIIHGFFYTVVSRNNFGKLSSIDRSINTVDKRNDGLGYVWYSYNNMIYIITSDGLKDNELIYMKEEDIPIFLRKDKIKKLKSIKK